MQHNVQQQPEDMTCHTQHNNIYSQTQSTHKNNTQLYWASDSEKNMDIEYNTSMLYIIDNKVKTQTNGGYNL